MAEITFIDQQALGGTAAIKLKTLFAGLTGGNAYSLKNLGPGVIAFGEDNAVTATNGWPVAVGESVNVDGGNLGSMWVIGAAADRVAVMVLR